MSCCPPGSWPALEAVPGTYYGKEEDIGGGTKAYVSKPEVSNNCGIISFQDVYKYDSARNKAIADQFALEGFTVVLVDFTEDTPYEGPVDMDRLLAWVKERPFEKLKPKLSETVIPYMKERLGVKKIGTIGFCWGCYLSFQACADPDIKDNIAAQALFHPSLVLNSVFGGHPECNDVAEKVETPTLFVAAGNDPEFVWPDGSVMKILQKKCPSSKGVLMKDMAHGFVNRGDVSQEDVKEGVKKAIEHAAAFLKEQLDS